MFDAHKYKYNEFKSLNKQWLHSVVVSNNAIDMTFIHRAIYVWIGSKPEKIIDTIRS